MALKNFTLKEIILLTLCVFFITLTASYIFTMQYIVANTMTEQMEAMWSGKIKNMASQSVFPVTMESKTHILRVAELISDPQVIHLSVFSNKLLYSKGKRLKCKNINYLTNYVSNQEGYFCFNQVILRENDNKTIGNIVLIVSKNKLNDLINKSTLKNIFITFLLTSVFFGFLYFIVKRLLAPLSYFSEAMKKISKNERGLRLNKKGTLDVQYIQNAFNSMMDRIETTELDLDEKVISRTLELSRAYKIEKESSHAKSEILRIVSHEMKTPLAGACLYIELMKENKGTYVNEISECLNRLNIQTNNLLSFYKISANNIKLNEKYFLMSDLFKLLLLEYEVLIQKNKNKLYLKNSYFGGINSDEQLLSQIIGNFLSNANKFTSKGDITIECVLDGRGLFISVSDTGCGISSENIKKVFDPYWQENTPSPNRIYNGTGLGLSICFLFAEAIKGEIRVESTLGVGTKFTLFLPKINM